MIHAFLADVQTRADAATPRLLADLLTSNVPSRYCDKCVVKLRDYVRLKLAAYHAKKRSWRWEMTHAKSAPTDDRISSVELDAKIQSARSDFYNTPCLCGEREEYAPK